MIYPVPLIFLSKMLDPQPQFSTLAGLLLREILTFPPPRATIDYRSLHKLWRFSGYYAPFRLIILSIVAFLDLSVLVSVVP